MMELMNGNGLLYLVGKSGREMKGRVGRSSGWDWWGGLPRRSKSRQQMTQRPLGPLYFLGLVVLIL